MRSTTIAREYAEALFLLGEKTAQEEEFGSAFSDLTRLLREEARFGRFLDSPKIQLGQKQAVVRKALDGRVPQLFLHFLLLVLERGRQRLIPFIAEEYQELLDRKSGRFPVEVTIAREIDDTAEHELADRLSALLERHVVPSIKVDPRILGGILVRFGDWVLDGSLRRRLMLLRRRMLAAVAPADG